MRKAIFLLAMLVLVTSSAFAKTLKVGDNPPNLLGKNLAGEKVHVSDYPDRVVVVTFWASWCAPCRAELPILDALQGQIPNDRLQVIAVNMGEGKKAVEWLSDLLKTPSTMVTWWQSRRISTSYGVEGIPHMFVIGKDGRIAKIHVGYGKEMIPKLVDELVALVGK